MSAESKRKPRWWSGGVCSAIAVTTTHPIDLIKVQLQTQVEKVSVGQLIKNVYDKEGFLGFYSGISASWFRQLTYTTTRFAVYESGKPYVNTDSFLAKAGLATFAGLVGGLIGVPGDVVTVRLQNDMKLPPEKRRNYKHVFDGLFRIYREEGPGALFKGAAPAITRAILLTIGTNASYDQVKQIIKGTIDMNDGLPLHFLTSSIAGCIGTIMTQPLDVVKTKTMNAKPGEFKNIIDVFLHTLRLGPLAFYKGFIPALMRVSPNTIVTFVLYEQARMRFGWLPEKE